MAGEVVFLCGSGISAPQLPDFKTLVDRTYERLGVEMSPSEYSAYTAGRYEETLGSLSRNLADPAAMVHTVSDLLKVPADPKLEQHQTVLRLSRDLSNRVLVVTTNFDTLLEHALPKIFSSQAIRDASFAGQALPAPGSPDFCGVVHIHGRLEDNSLELESTPLVLTSADYGDAYMRSGWASRFLFDLARCKTIVLIGYSAGDAPVRYFLNVLEADRIRFPDLKPVYALDAYEHNPAETEAAWSTVAVTPLPYCKFDPESGVPNHSPLWQDLARLADVLDRPKLSRERLARDILGQRDPSPNDGELGQLSWLFAKRGDLWPTIVEATDNPRWFDVLQDNGFWTADEAAWVIPAWTARNPENSEVFGVAAKWALKLGEPFLRNLDRRLLRSNLSPFWQKCWRLLTTSRPVLPDAFDEEAAALNQKLRSGVVLDVDLQRSVERLKPNVVLQSRSWIPDSENDGREPGQLSDIAGIGLEVADNFHVSELIGGLDALTGQSPRILELATEALRSLLQSAVELGLINGDDDATDYDVPSVEEHEQNEHHQGVIFLVRAIVNAFNKTVAINRDLARHVAFRCLEMPGRIGIRITLYALRNTEAFTSNEAIDVLLNLRDSDFWTIRRELPLVLRDRSAEAEPTRLEAIESRIRQTAARYYDRYEIQEGQVDWRTHARDAEIWLRLMMLKEAGVLSVAGADNLAAIVARQEYLDRPTEDRDFFGIYSSGVRSVAGDSAPIMEADPDERLQVAIELSQSPNLDRQLGWLSYCRTDPQGAFETLVGAELSETNLILWADLLTTLSFGEESTKQLRETLIVKSLAKLEAIEVGIDTRLARTLIDTLLLGPRRDIANVEDWCDRLWRTVCDEEQDVVYDDNLYDTAINRMPGRLAQIQLQEIDHSRETDNSDLARQLNRLEVMASHPGAAGAFSRPIFIQALPFLLAADSRFSKSELVARLSGDGDEPRALRRILVTHAGVTPEISKLVPEAVLRAVVESSSDTKDGVPIAAQILRPAVASLRNDQPERWGISEADVGRVLRQAPGKIRAGALNVLAQWLAADQEGPEKAWTAMVAPFFNRIWPVERRFVDHAHNIHLIRLIVGAGDHFPSALNLLRPHLRPFSRSASLHSLKNSSALRKFPYAVLDLLWTVLGPSDATSYELAEILDELIDVDPNIEIDRRFQFLEQKATRYR
ncbi:SIR2 family protein [Rhizobium calliandrae]|uniref:SIR2 family protein n=1 Tax=Rhizobium calliandrae TaxID=1312182 RepID=A0ABT7KG45_9HYPH|nr:SIR2 family protein [Rhizobium calliandrae]MDL2407592.1 SIR2 family protein [Rhizobium calliandrae]